MIETLDKLLEISDFLGNCTFLEGISQMKSALEKKEYLLTVMGQFSAGKSRLINNLVGKQILPVHITETTALITFIHYGTEEYVNLIHKDGMVERVEIEESLKLWQSGENGEKIASLEYVDIFINSELLQNGLVIADTPGINTILSEHLTLTAKAVDAADRVLYVMGKPLTDSDRTFVQGILDSGIQVIFARTHIDNLKYTEENKEQAIFHEKEILLSFTDDEIFFVSNEEKCEDFSEVLKLRDYLKVNLADKVDETLREAVAYKEKAIADKLLKEITEKKIEVGSVLSGNRTEYMAKKTELEDTLKEMDVIIARNKEKLRKKYEETKNEAKEQLKEEKKYVEKGVNSIISQISFDVPQDKILSKVESCVKDGCRKLEQSYLAHFNQMFADNKKVLEDKLAQFDFYTTIDANIPETLNEADDLSVELADKYAALQVLEGDLNQKLAEYDTMNEDSDRTHKDILAEQVELQQVLHSVQEELQGFPEYTARYVVTQQADNSHEKIFRSVGNVVDIASIFIPAKGWATIGTKVLGGAAKGAKAIKAANVAAKIEKAAAVIGQMGKAGQAVDTAIDVTRTTSKLFRSKKQIQALEEAERVARQCRNLKDGLEIAQNVKDHIPQSTGILDYLSFEYWFAKVGKKLDTPEIKEIDREYENLYRHQKDEILKRVKDATEAEYQKRCELLDIKDKQEQIKLEREITERKMKKAQEDMSCLEREIKAKKAQAKAEAFREFYLDASAKKIEEFCEYLNSDIAAEIDESVIRYINTHDFSITTSINRKRKELEELDKAYHTISKEEMEQALSRCSEYEKFIKSLSPE